MVQESYTTWKNSTIYVGFCLYTFFSVVDAGFQQKILPAPRAPYYEGIWDTLLLLLSSLPSGWYPASWRIIPVSKWLITMDSKFPM